MVRSLPLISLVFVLTLGACAPTTVLERSPSPPAATIVSRDMSVVYRRSGGFAGADDTWTFAADGTVSQQGHTPNTPERLTTAQMAELTAAIRGANFMALENSYVPRDTCCDRYLYEITVTLGGQSKTVRTIDAAPAAPAELTQLIDMLNRLVAPAR